MLLKITRHRLERKKPYPRRYRRIYDDEKMSSIGPPSKIHINGQSMWNASKWIGVQPLRNSNWCDCRSFRNYSNESTLRIVIANECNCKMTSIFKFCHSLSNLSAGSTSFIQLHTFQNNCNETIKCFLFKIATSHSSHIIEYSQVIDVRREKFYFSNLCIARCPTYIKMSRWSVYQSKTYFKCI